MYSQIQNLKPNLFGQTAIKLRDSTLWYIFYGTQQTIYLRIPCWKDLSNQSVIT
jgi:hypothetical protein